VNLFWKTPSPQSWEGLCKHLLPVGI
jgi:hypothetical protein